MAGADWPSADVCGPLDEGEAVKVIHRAIDVSVDLIDTGGVYGAGTNERLVGRAITDRRDSVVLATEFGNVIQPDGSRVVNGRHEYVHQACDASLQRLGTDSIDLYYLDRVDKVVPIEETVGAMTELVGLGKVGFPGLSEAHRLAPDRRHPQPAQAPPSPDRCRLTAAAGAPTASHPTSPAAAED